MNTKTELDLTDDVINVSDITSRLEGLEDASDGLPNAEERCLLASILDALKGEGGDVHWRGDWYPLLLIRDSHFESYARELLEDCGELPANFPHYIEIDWERTARNIRVDYSRIEIDGVNYWYR